MLFKMYEVYGDEPFICYLNNWTFSEEMLLQLFLTKACLNLYQLLKVLERREIDVKLAAYICPSECDCWSLRRRRVIELLLRSEQMVKMLKSLKVGK